MPEKAEQAAMSWRKGHVSPGTGCVYRGSRVPVKAHGTPVYTDMTVVSALALGMEVFLLFLH